MKNVILILSRNVSLGMAAGIQNHPSDDPLLAEKPPQCSSMNRGQTEKSY